MNTLSQYHEYQKNHMTDLFIDLWDSVCAIRNQISTITIFKDQTTIKSNFYWVKFIILYIIDEKQTNYNVP